MNYPAASGRGIKSHCEQNTPRGEESNPCRELIEMIDRSKIVLR